MRLIHNQYRISQVDSILLEGMLLEQVIIRHEDDMGGVFHGFGVKVWTKLLTFALENYLLEILCLCGLFHVQVVLLGLIESALLALLVRYALATLKALILTG